MTLRYCKTCGNGTFHDLDEPWPCQQPARSSGIQIIKDIEPYQAVAIDVATGKRPKIKSRGEHREFLKRNGFHEHTPIKREPVYADVSPREVKQIVDRARDEVMSRRKL